MISLVMAASTGLDDIVRRLLDQKADPNATLPSSTATMASSSSTAPSVSTSSSSSSRSAQSDSPLVAAATAGHAGCVALLLAANAHVDAPSGVYHRSALVASCMYGHHTIVDLLIAARANVHGTSIPTAAAATTAAATITPPTAISTNDTPLSAAICGPPIVRTPAAPRRPAGTDTKDETKKELVTVEQRVAVINSLVKAGVDVNARYYHDHLVDSWWTPLVMCAASSAQVAVARVLLDAGARVNMAAGYGDTALTHAAIHGHIPLVQCLIAAGARGESITLPHNHDAIAAIAHGTQPALLAAATNGQTDVVKLLLSQGAAMGVTVNQLGTRGDTALMMAAQSNHVDIIEILVDNGADVHILNANRQNALMKCSGAECTARLISAGCDARLVDASGNTALCMAATEECLDIVQWLTSAGADVNHRNSNGATPLMLAAWRGDDDIVRHLANNCSAAADGITNDGSNALSMIAASHGGADMVSLLISLKCGVDVINNDGETPLTLAAMCGHSHMISRLIDHGANVNHIAHDGETALIRTTRGICYNGVRALLEAKAAVDYIIPDPINDKRTSLWIAVEHKLESTIELLVAARADVNHRNGAGHSLVSVAIANNDTASLHRLLAAGAHHDEIIDVPPPSSVASSTSSSSRSVRQYTPLNWACSLGHVDCASAILTHVLRLSDAATADGKQANASSSSMMTSVLSAVAACDGSTPLLWAARRGDVPLIILLCDTLRSSSLSLADRRLILHTRSRVRHDRGTAGATAAGGGLASEEVAVKYGHTMVADLLKRAK